MVRNPLLAAILALAVGTDSSTAFAGGDAAAGKKIFPKCAACHTLKPGKKKVGPSLHGVIGRVPGTAKGFKYSKAMTAHGASGIVWDEETLDAFLTGPRKVVKGTKMSFPGLKKAEDRANVIAYLKQAAEQ